MGWINKSWGQKQANRFYLKPYGTDLKFFQVVKIRDKSTCCCCGKKLNSGTWCYGESYLRLCISCWENEYKNIFKDFTKLMDSIRETKKYHELNKEKWNNENAITNL